MLTFVPFSVAVEGNNFVAKNMGIENTAGPPGGQAVALRVSADCVVIFNCQIDGYQDTLYVHSHRQFYRDSTISGTVDFIFGDSIAIFQNCNIVVRKPMGGQGCMVTAQGRTDVREPTAIVLHNCRIIGEPAYLPVKNINKAYLGRPWKEFARTIVMRTTISDVIDPAGWSAWSGDFALKTLFYAEYENSGPGSNKAQRVKWPSIQRITRPQALGFAPGRFLSGGSWIPQTGFFQFGNKYMKRDIDTCIERILGGFPENLQKRDNFTLASARFRSRHQEAIGLGRFMFAVLIIQTKEPKQVQGRGRKGHDIEVDHEEDDATTFEQQPIEKQAEEFSGEWDTNVPEQAGEEQGNEKAGGQRKGRSVGIITINIKLEHHLQTISMEQPKQQPPGPRMPDGTRGFSMGRGKPITVQAD
ncbi:hypothetical protein F2Q70_00030840 [Brassica cretica]|uniref:Pectinesterase n=1 Tax=Brassica cretica TaxID=69181 RepID=A0A8S9FIP0_BRACR|nr:hypothetical protein F2Q70_00030840 [Brassica cretica]